MIKTVFNGQTVFVANDEWDGQGPLVCKASLLRDDQAGLTKHESRRPYSATLRSELKFQCVVMDAALLQLQGCLRQLTTEGVIVPLWPAICYWQDRAAQKIKGGLMVAFKVDWTQYEVYVDGAEPGWPGAFDFCAPALFGYLKNQGSGNGPELRDTNIGIWSVDFVESSPAAYALKITAAALTDGPQPAGYGAAPKLLPLQPDFVQMKEELRLSVTRQSIGMDRESAATFYPHDVYRAQNASYTLQSASGGDEIATLLSWFLQVAGPGNSFWAVNGFVMGTLSADAGAGAVALQLNDASAWQMGDYLTGDTGAHFAQVNTIAGNTLNLVAAMGVALTAGTPLFGLFLARLDKPELQINWEAPGIVQVKVPWTEVRPEKVIPFSETLGATIGQLPLRVVLFQFTRDFGNGTVSNWYFTGYESDITWSGHTWLHSSINTKSISTSVNLEEDSCDIVSFIEPGNPLVDDLAQTAEAPLSVKIWFADYDGVNVTNAVVQFYGDCTAPSREGKKITVKGAFGPSFFDTDLPRFIRGTVCNHIGGSNDGTFLISAGCTLLRTDWKCTATIAGPVSSAFPATVNLATFVKVGAGVAAATVQANFFVNGWIEWGAGANIQRRLIVGSTAPAGGTLTLTLHKYFKGLPNIGDAVTIYPGCDGLYETCKAYDAVTNPNGRFNNGDNFGAEPFTPVGNPSVAGIPTLGTQGGKK